MLDRGTCFFLSKIILREFWQSLRIGRRLLVSYVDYKVYVLDGVCAGFPVRAIKGGKL